MSGNNSEERNLNVANVDALSVFVGFVIRGAPVTRESAFYCANPTWIVTVAYTVTTPVCTGVVTAAPALVPTTIGA